MACILVVDDDAAFRAAVREILETAGYTVVEAGDGRDSVAYVRTHPVDLIVLDLLMPEQDGLETIRLLRRVAPALKMIAISGGGYMGRLNLLELARRLGAHRTLRKPLKVEALLETIQSLMAEGTGEHGGDRGATE
jgi:two-component system chemotaxis response regulator CheY